MTAHSEAVPTGAGRGAVDIAQKFDSFTEHWSPKIIAESNGWQFKLVKASGKFVGHQHEIDDHDQGPYVQHPNRAASSRAHGRRGSKTCATSPLR
jgi:hypothetical protein